MERKPHKLDSLFAAVGLRTASGSPTGGWYDSDDIFLGDPLDAVNHVVGICGCSDGVLKYVRDSLVMITGIGAQGPAMEFFSNMADNSGWVEHGVSCRFPFFTDKGRAVVELLNAYLDEEDDA